MQVKLNMNVPLNKTKPLDKLNKLIPEGAPKINDLPETKLGKSALESIKEHLETTMKLRAKEIERLKENLYFGSFDPKFAINKFHIETHLENLQNAQNTDKKQLNGIISELLNIK